jgi:hypothetical protein
MKSSNLAERLEEFEATLDSLRLTPEPTIRMDVQAEANPERNQLQARSRRGFRVGAIVSRDQGLRAFRVF